MTRPNPFGQTDVTADEYREAIDVEDAVEYLSEGDVSDPRNCVEDFVKQVPDLLEWLADNGRSFPWRRADDPWRIYISEILLQRTRAEAVKDVYDEFFDRFPEPEYVIEADDEEIFTTVKSLGFGNQRTRSLREAAHLCSEHEGTPPADVDVLKEPWRVGPYSARACLLFGHEIPVALVDSNIARIVGRVFEYSMPSQPHKATAVYDLMESLTPQTGDLARGFYFSLLDLGAAICRSETPECDTCPLFEGCVYSSA